MQSVLVTGGAGYIGSVTVEALLDAGYQVAVYDDLRHGHRAAIDPRAKRIELGTERVTTLARILEDYDAVVHFAASISVGESMEKPAEYFQNNVANTIGLLNAMHLANLKQLVFSSTAAVFGDPMYVPIDEAHPRMPLSPYGRSKLLVEQMLPWYQQIYGLQYVALRYFNAAGATEKFGEDHKPEEHLIPILLEVAEQKRPMFSLMGNNYPTPDGTCIRDFVHVSDLAQAHLLALQYTANGESGCFNLGTGNGYSIWDTVATAEHVTGKKIPTQVVPARAGDSAQLVASPKLAKQELGWRPLHESLEAIIESAWQWRQRHPNGYQDA